MLRTHHCAQLTSADLGAKVSLVGWVDSVRDHGGIIFVDLRDRAGWVQVLFPEEPLKSQAAELSAEDVIRVTGTVRPRPAEIRERVVEKLKVVDLGEEVLGRFPAELSGGMRKRVALARALVSDPQVVLYDEPTTGLDPITTDYVDTMIKGAKEKLGITSMVISHDIASAFNVADRLAVLYDGHLVAEGTPGEIRASEHPFVKKFLSTWFEKQ